MQVHQGPGGNGAGGRSPRPSPRRGASRPPRSIPRAGGPASSGRCLPGTSSRRCSTPARRGTASSPGRITARCVTIDEITSFIRSGDDVRVIDEHDNDITRRVLLQLILDDPGRSGIDLLPIPLLRTMIAVRNETMVRWLEQYLSAGAEWLDRQ